MSDSQLTSEQPRSAAALAAHLASVPWLQLAVISLQLTLLFLVIYRYDIESSLGFVRLLPVILGGFIVHAVIPQAWRMACFVIVSIIGIAVVLPLAYAAALIGCGLVLLGICHLPLPLLARIGLLLVAAAGLAMVRAGWLEAPGDFATVAVPVLAAMFMFRLALYLYDLRHETAPVSIWARLGYFFMLPNVCFLLFPVVDWKAFRRTHYNTEPISIYHKGLLWIARGIIQLLLYRIVYQFFVPEPGDIQGLGTVVQFVLTSYLLYLRVSGLFHLIVGLLCLFGFNLHETHHLYYLASGVSDFWRRINIYWKDFMMKLFFLPLVIPLRRFGEVPAIILATIAVFFGTWILHSYQWFWLRGTFPIAGTDGVFWGLLGVLVVVNSLMEMRPGRKRARAAAGFELSAALSVAVRTVAMFSFMCVLWSFWSSPSIDQWLATVSAAGNAGFTDVVLLLAGLVTLVGIGVAWQYLTRNRGSARRRKGPAPLIPADAWTVVPLALVLLLVSVPQVRVQLPQQAGKWLASISTDQLNSRDSQLAERGYYEGLLVNANFTAPSWTMFGQTGARPNTPEWYGIRGAHVISPRNDLLEYELRPGLATSWKESEFTTNEWGMRDQPYPLEKPLGAFRLAMLGASYEQGAGVRADEVFEARVEARANAADSDVHYEIMNFAVGGYGMVQKLLVLRDKVPRFKPDAALLTIYATEDVRTLSSLASAMKLGLDLEYPYLKQIRDRADIDWLMSSAEVESRLRPLVPEVIAWSMQQIAEEAERQGLRLITVYLPVTPGRLSDDESSKDQVLNAARAAGLDPIVLGDLFAGEEPAELELRPWDSHPSAMAHKLIADGLYGALFEGADPVLP